MTDVQQDTSDHSRAVFAGLTPHLPPEPERSSERSRLSRSMFSTGSVLLAGSMAAMTINMTAPIDPVEARTPQPKGVASEPGTTVREAIAAAATARATALRNTITVATVPATYTVRDGDTISAIAGRHGLSTASVLALNGLSWSSLIFPGQQLKLASAVTAVPIAETRQATPSGRYTIVAGDTISAIAHRFGVSTLSVLSANGLGWSSIIYPGQTLTIPGLVGPGTPAPESDPVPTTPATAVEESEETLDIVPVVDVTPIAETTAPPAEPAPSAPAEPAPPAAPTPAAPAPAPPAVSGNYTIVSGDTIGRIATKFGISTQALLEANGLSASSVIYAGRTLIIPGALAPASSGTPSPAPAPAAGATVTGMTDEMRGNAAIIVQVGRQLGVPDYGIIIALAAAMQESTLRNLSWGDRDSVGLFQQRPSAGWGTVEQLTTPEHAARLFYGGPSNPNRGYTRGLLDIAGWQGMSVTQAAQRVQISAYPNAYAKWETSARAWFAELG